MLFFAGCCRPAAGQETEVDREYTIKAAYLYNFGKYVEWPPRAAPGAEGGTFTIGVVGPHPFGDALATIARTKTLKGKPITILPIRTASDYRPCRILFVTAGASDQLTAAVLQRARESSTLIVGETEGFARGGAMVNFYVENNKVKFEFNADAARRAGLKISSKLLRIGRLVSDG